MQIPVTVPPNFRIIAHRGASSYAPENTRPAFELALRMGRPQVELDAQLSTDEQVVLCHDTTLARYGHGEQIVETLDWATLSNLDMGSWFSPYLFPQTPMLTLDGLFESFGDRLFYHLEIKGKAAGLPQAVYTRIQQAGLAASCIITSFSYDALVAMRALDDNIRMGWLIREIDAGAVEKAAALSLYQLCPLAATVTPEMVELARPTVREVRAWGLMGNTPTNQQAEVCALIQRVVDAGCDGMTINWPDWAVNAS
jgi:glycerophosphoryl diester phosphodiesterase